MSDQPTETTCSGYHGVPECSDRRCYHHDARGLVRWFSDDRKYHLRIGGGPAVARAYDRGDTWCMQFCGRWWTPGDVLVGSGAEAVAKVIEVGRAVHGVDVPWLDDVAGPTLVVLGLER